MDQTRHKRKWHQFSLRTLLLTVTAFSVVMGLIGWKLQDIRKWQRLLDKLNRCPYAEWSFGKPVTLNFMDPLDNFHLTDDDLAVVGKISSLRLLRISYAPNVTDNGIRHLSKLKELRGLVLSNTRLTDAGLKHLKPLHNLTGLGLRGNNITNEGLVHLLALSKLRRLELAGTNVTDAGLPILEKLPNIHFLTLGPTKPGLSAEALEKLRRAKPQWDVSEQQEEYPELDVGKPHYPVTKLEGPLPIRKPPGITRILVSEITETGIGALMICTVEVNQLERLELRQKTFKPLDIVFSPRWMTSCLVRLLICSLQACSYLKLI